MKKLFILQILLLSILATKAQTTNSKTAIAVDPTYLLANRTNIADRAIQEWVDKGWMNGGVGLIMHNGKIAYYKAFGYDNIEKKTPMRVDHIFRIASQTKAITSVAVMMLFEEGKFLLDEPISKFIPEFKNPHVLDKFNETDSSYTTTPAKREVTIRDLLTHTSGIGYAQIGSAASNAIYAKNGVVGGIGVDNITLALLDVLSTKSILKS